MQPYPIVRHGPNVIRRYKILVFHILTELRLLST